MNFTNFSALTATISYPMTSKPKVYLKGITLLTNRAPLCLNILSHSHFFVCTIVYNKEYYL